MASAVCSPTTTSRREMQVFFIVNTVNPQQPKSSNYNPSVHGRRIAFVHFSVGGSAGVVFLDTIVTLSSGVRPL